MTAKTILGVTLACMVAISTMTESSLAQQCGPGPHWIDECAGGVSTFPVRTFVGVDITNDCVEDLVAEAFGLITVTRSDPMDTSNFFPGLGEWDGHLDVIDTQINSGILHLRGYHPPGSSAGRSIFGIIGGGLPSTLGAIVEHPDDPTLGDSFFDINFAVQIEACGPDVFLYNQTPMRIEAVIDWLPPFDTEYVYSGCLPLFTNPVPGYGDSLAVITSATFQIPTAINLELAPTDTTDVQAGDTLFFDTIVRNYLEGPAEGDLWLSVQLPNGNELEIPESVISRRNPLSGQIGGGGMLELPYEVYIPAGVDTGSFSIIGRIGVHPDNTKDEDWFRFRVVE